MAIVNGVELRHFPYLDLVKCQELFDQVTKLVISQGAPSYIGQLNFDSSSSYIGFRDGKITRCPIGFLMSTEQVKKYGVNPATFICSFPDELIKELVPNSGVVCARHFLGKLQRAHDDAFVSFKRAKGKSDFVADYIVNSNMMAAYFLLKGIS